jgi:hypothetical protein
MARKRVKIIVPKITQEIAELETKLDLLGADQDISEEDRKISSTLLIEKLVVLQKKRNN